MCAHVVSKPKSKRIINTKFGTIITYLEEREMDVLGKVLVEHFEDISGCRWGM